MARSARAAGARGAGRGGGRCRGRTPGSRQVTGIALTASHAARDRRSRQRGHTCHRKGLRGGPSVTGTHRAPEAPSPSPTPASAAPRASPARAEFKLRYCPSRKAPTPLLPRVPPLFRLPANSEAASLPYPPIRARFIAGWEEALGARGRPLWSWFLARSRRVLLSRSPAPSPRALLVPLSGERRRRLRPAAMPEFLADPSVLTKEKLKSELIANNVSLPGGEQRKDVYVQLYLQHLTARNPPALAQPDFSSDEEREPTPLGARSRGAAAAGRVSTAASRPRCLSLLAASGPLSLPNGAGRLRPRLGERRDAPRSPHGVGRVSGSAEGGIVPLRDGSAAWG